MINHKSLTQNLEQISVARYELANHLEEMTAILTTAEMEGEKFSGRLSLDRAIAQLYDAFNNLRKNKFKLLVLGDMKRGKSTFINALIGENLLPSDVNPCTALLTILRYGEKRRVSIYFKEDSQPEILDINAFKQKYTIDSQKAELLAEKEELAFPHVAYAVIEYPLSLLKEGLEIIDSPGLNDTAARNELTLQHIYNCHAVLFVLKASQPCTLDERRYLKNNLQGRDITTFFVINAWDEIKKGLVNPDDPEAVKLAEEKVRQVFRANLHPFLASEQYTQRVFEVSALNTLRQRLKNPSTDFQDTSLNEFIVVLDKFLTEERAIAELKQAQIIAKTISYRVDEAVNRRIPLLDENIAELKQRIASTAPEFAELQKIRDSFKQEIELTQTNVSQSIADSFSDFILDLEKTFETDFLATQPEINFADFLDKNKREEFQFTFKRAFERYLNDRLASWEFTAKQKLASSFDNLNKSGTKYQLDYAEVVDSINQKLLGSRFRTNEYRQGSQQVSPWADNFNDIFFGVPDGFNDVINSFNTFWQTVLASICITLGLRVISLLFTGIALNIFGAILLGMGTVALQAEYVRRQFLTVTKTEFAKYLPQIAAEQKPLVLAAIKRCFETYSEQVINVVDHDLRSRQLELSNLLEQKENSEINRESEIKRLNDLKENIQREYKQVEDIVFNLD